MSEQVIYEDPASGWRVTRDWARFGPTNYAIAQINSVSRQRIDASRFWPGVFFVAGLAILAFGAFLTAVVGMRSGVGGMVCPALIAFAGGVGTWVGYDTWKKALPSFNLRIHTSATEQQWVLCASEQQMIDVEAALMHAVTLRSR